MPQDGHSLKSADTSALLLQAWTTGCGKPGLRFGLDRDAN
jgi:hypothetical protein